MEGVHSTGAGLLPRLLADAERHAADGRVREAFVLLRWASRVAPPASLPVVLLAYHRVRAARKQVGGAAVGKLAAEALRLSPRPAAGAGVASDALGFPVPRFPTRAPELDPEAFVPAPRIVEPPSRTRSPAPAVRPHSGRATRRQAAAVLLLAAVLAMLCFAPETARKVGVRLTGEKEVEVAAEAALRAGEPARALAITDEVSDPPPEVILIRARSLLALGDTSDGAAALSAVAAHPLASAMERSEAARLLGMIPESQDAAADAYLRAFSAGLPLEEWRAVAESLERAGRPEQARRVRELWQRQVPSSAVQQMPVVSPPPGPR
jgi:hypothetical protein